MQQHISYQSRPKVASDSSRQIIYVYIFFVGAVLILLISSAFFPGSWHDQFFPKSPALLHALSASPFAFIAYIFFPAVLIWPFLSLPVSTWFFLWPFGGKWKYLERDRQQAVANHVNGETAMTFSLPQTLAPLPTTLSVQMRRNWKATWIAGAFYAPLIGAVLWTFISTWQVNMQYLAQQGEISTWTLLGSLSFTLVCLWYTVPALSAFLFAPRQRVIATQDGLIGYRGLRLSYIPWQDARLFAAIAEEHGMLVYELASRTSIIRWSSKPAWSYGDTYPGNVIGIAPLGLMQAEHSEEEYCYQIQQLTAMVAARTGLPLYDLCFQSHQQVSKVRKSE